MRPGDAADAVGGGGRGGTSRELSARRRRRWSATRRPLRCPSRRWTPRSSQSAASASEPRRTRLSRPRWLLPPKLRVRPWCRWPKSAGNASGVGARRGARRLRQVRLRWAQYGKERACLSQESLLPPRVRLQNPAVVAGIPSGRRRVTKSRYEALARPSALSLGRAGGEPCPWIGLPVPGSAGQSVGGGEVANWWRVAVSLPCDGGPGVPVRGAAALHVSIRRTEAGSIGRGCDFVA